MSEENVENPLGYEKISTLLRKFAVPGIIAMVVNSIYNIVDQIFIGWGVGYLGNAATNVAFPVTVIAFAVFLSLGVGGATRYSIYLGEKRTEDAAKVVGIAVTAAVAFGIIYAAFVFIFLKQMLFAFGATDEIFKYALQYTSITNIGLPFIVIMNVISHTAMADGSPKYSMLIMVTGGIINTILDPIFIFVFQLGVAGAAWATVIAQIVSFSISVVYLKKFKRVTLKKEYFRLNLRQAMVTVKYGMSQGLNQCAMCLVMVCMNRTMVHYGALSIYGAEIPLAASGIVMKVNAIVIAVLIGISQGMQPIIGFNYGARKYDRVKKTYFLAIECELAITIIAVICFHLFPEYILSIFGKGDELYMEFSVKFMKCFLCALPLGAVQMLSSNLFASIGKSVKGALLSLTRQVIFFIPILFVLPIIYGINGLFWVGPTSDVLAFVTTIACVIHEFRHSDLSGKKLKVAIEA
ncbi:MATE family efflux transporter [Treponema sp.]|uniref:MATE family efflux transporter n=1 Tax=Treponema sp. TaxID=166 RepID=UPI00298EAADE|nr:MATE family efflux transporter [Treponema sp.]